MNPSASWRLVMRVLRRSRFWIRYQIKTPHFLENTIRSRFEERDGNRRWKKPILTSRILVLNLKYGCKTHQKTPFRAIDGAFAGEGNISNRWSPASGEDDSHGRVA